MSNNVELMNLDPNTTKSGYLFSSHSNSPDEESKWHILTYFHTSVENYRSQIATRSGVNGMMYRNYDGDWSEWESVGSGVADDGIMLELALLEAKLDDLISDLEDGVVSPGDIIDYQPQIDAINLRLNELMVEAHFDIIHANTAHIANLTSGSIDAINAKLESAFIEYANINTLLAGNLTASNFKANSITADSGVIANGAILNSMILNLDVAKVNAGDISTDKFKIISDSGNMSLQSNTLKVWDTTGQERVSLGKNGTDYNLLVRGSDGETVLFGDDGVTHAGITEGSIDDSKVAGNANISGDKLNINSVVTNINAGTSLIESTHINLNGQNLNVKFGLLEGTISDNSDVVESLLTDFTIEQGKVSSLITDVQMVTGESAESVSRISSLEQTSDSFGVTLSELSTKSTTLLSDVGDLKSTTSGLQGEISDIDGRVGEIDVVVNETTSKLSTLRNDLDGFQQGVSSTYVSKTELVERLDEATQAEKLYAMAKSELERIKFEAYSDGIITEEERASITQALSDVEVAKANLDRIVDEEFSSTRNLILDSGVERNSESSLIHEYKLSKEIDDNELVTISITASLGSPVEQLEVWNGINVRIALLSSFELKHGAYSITVPWKSTPGVNNKVRVLQKPVGSTSIKNIQLTIGNKAFAWSPAPEDFSFDALELAKRYADEGNASLKSDVEDYVDTQDAANLTLAKTDAKTKADAAEAAAKTYALIQADAKRIEAESYADGIVTAEETARINDVNAKLELAKTDATNKADAAEAAAITAAALDAKAKADKALTDAKTDASNKATAAQTAAETYAKTKAEAETVIAKAYADGEIDKEETARIADVNAKLVLAKTDATNKANAAQTAAINAAKLDATTKANSAKDAAVVLANAKAEAERVLAEAYADGLVDAEEQARIKDVNDKLAEAKLDAKTKADAARDAAITAAELDATTKANTAKDAAITAANSKAEAERVLAEAYADGIVTAEETKRIAALELAATAASEDAEAKADSAQAAAILAAATDAKNKADKALSDAKLDATAKADNAESKAKIAAATDAKNKADAALVAAKTDAKNKADAALVAAKNHADAQDAIVLSTAKSDATTKANAAKDAADLVAEAKANQARVDAEAHADGIVTAEERARIDDVNDKLAAAQADAKVKADAAQAAAEEYARAQDASNLVTSKNYTNSKVSDITGSLDEIEIRVGDAETLLTTTSSGLGTLSQTVNQEKTKLATITTKTNAIDLKIIDHDSSISTIDGKVSSQDSRLQTAELKLTPSAIKLSVEENTKDKLTYSSLELIPDHIKIKSKNINLIGAVSVLSDITGNLGSITAGNISGTNITGSTFNSSYRITDSYGTKNGTMYLMSDYLKMIDSYDNGIGEYSNHSAETTYSPRGVYHNSGRGGIGTREYNLDINGLTWESLPGGNDIDNSYSFGIRKIGSNPADMEIYNNLTDSDTYVNANDKLYLKGNSGIILSSNTTITDGLNVVGLTDVDDLNVSGAISTPNGRKAIITEGDFNDLKDEWTLALGTNAPAGSDYWYVNTIMYGNVNQKKQIAYAYRGNDTYTRRCYLNTWSSWEKIQNANTGSNVVNGWTKDSSTGLITQWGTTNHDTNVGFIKVNYPITFPNAVLNFSASARYDSGVDLTAHIVPQSNTVSNGLIYFRSGAGSATVKASANWMAIGY